MAPGNRVSWFTELFRVSTTKGVLCNKTKGRAKRNSNLNKNSGDVVLLEIVSEAVSRLPSRSCQILLHCRFCPERKREMSNHNGNKPNKRWNNYQQMNENLSITCHRGWDLMPGWVCVRYQQSPSPLACLVSLVNLEEAEKHKLVFLTIVKSPLFI